MDVVFPKFSSKLKKAQISKDDLVNGLHRACGPNDKDGKALGNANPHWPGANANWSSEFASKATDAIYSAVQSGWKTHSEELQEGVRESVQGIVSALEKMVIRDAKVDLLWIKMSMYSPSGQTGYGDLEPTDLILHSVTDISRVVSGHAPKSVEYFLHDLVSSVKNQKLKLVDVLTAIGPKISTQPEAESLNGDELPASGRRSLLDVAVRRNGPILVEQTGRASSYEDTPAKYAVLFYRELQIRKLLKK